MISVNGKYNIGGRIVLFHYHHILVHKIKKPENAINRNFLERGNQATCPKRKGQTTQKTMRLKKGVIGQGDQKSASKLELTVTFRVLKEYRRSLAPPTIR